MQNTCRHIELFLAFCSKCRFLPKQLHIFYVWKKETQEIQAKISILKHKTLKFAEFIDKILFLLPSGQSRYCSWKSYAMYSNLKHGFYMYIYLFQLFFVDHHHSLQCSWPWTLLFFLFIEKVLWLKTYFRFNPSDSVCVRLGQRFNIESFTFKTYIYK